MVSEETLVKLKIATITKKIVEQITKLSYVDYDRGTAQPWIDNGNVLGWIKMHDYRVLLRELNGEYKLDPTSNVPEGTRQIFVV